MTHCSSSRYIHRRNLWHLNRWTFLFFLLLAFSTNLKSQALDTDNDGIIDNVDLDDDNDGILDVDECMTSNFFWSNAPTVNGKTATGLINGVPYTYTSSINIETTPGIYKHATFPNSFNVPNIKVIKNRKVSNNSIAFPQAVLNPILVFSSIGSGGNTVPIKFSNPIEVLFQSGPVTIISPTEITGREGYVIVRMNGVFNQISFDYLANENYVNFTFGADFATFCDTDGDGTPDYLDLDSDNDGCPDAVEGGAGFKLTDINNGVLAGTIDANGVPLPANGGQTKGSSADATTESLVCTACDTKKPAINGVNGDVFRAFYFDAIRELNETVNGFAVGEKYKIKVTGTWSVWSNNPTKNVLDAAYRYKEKNASAAITPVNSLNWKINGVSPSRPIPDGYNVEHTYFFEQVASGAGEVFTWGDNNYGDNGGGMNFEFYKILDTIRGCASNTTTQLTDYVVGQNLKWYSTETSSDGTTVVPNIDNNIVGNTEYWVTQTIGGCESDRAQMFYLVKEIPVVNLGNDTTICTGSTITLNAGNHQSYLWNTAATGQTIDVSATGNYSVNVTSTKGCTNTSSINVTVNPCSIDFFEKDTLYVCKGESITISAKDVALTEWRGIQVFTAINDSMIEAKPAITSTYCISNFTKKKSVLANGGFEINGGTGQRDEATLPGWSTTAADKKVEIWANGFLGHPTFSGNFLAELNANEQAALYQDVATTPGEKLMWGFAHKARGSGVETVEFEVGPPGGPYNIIETAKDVSTAWGYYNGIYEIPTGQTTTRFYFSSTDPGGSGNLMDGIEFNTLNEQKDSVVVVVYNKPNVNLGNDITICEGESIALDAGVGYNNYDWSTGESTQKIDVNSSGAYKVEITNDNGCTQVDSMDLTIIPLPVVNLGSDATICADSTITFDAVVGTVWTWSNGDNTQATTVNSTGTYSVIVADGSGCTSYDTINLVTQALPVVTLGNDTTICADSTITFDAVVGTVWTWSNGDNTKTTILNSTGAYSVIVADAIGCTGYDTINLVMQAIPVIDLGNNTTICADSTITFDAVVGTVWNWSNGDNTQTTTVNTTGEYRVIVADAIGCTGYDTINLVMQAVPVIDLGNDTTICADSTITFDAVVGTVWTWSNGGNTQTTTVNSTGMHSVIVADAIGCTSYDTITLVMQALPVVDLGGDTTICEWDSWELDGGSPGLTHSWNTGARSQIIMVNDHGKYTVLVRDNIGCENSDSMLLSIDVVPDLFENKEHVICQGDSVFLFPSLIDASMETSWLENDSDNDTMRVTETEIYNGLVVSHHCQDTFPVQVLVLDTPSVEIIDIRGQKNYCFDFERPMLEVVGEDAYIVDVTWFPSEEITHVFEPTRPGTHTLLADDGTCKSIYQIHLETYCEGQVFTPNAFTPDGDGINDEFRAVSYYVEDYSLLIYDKWGSLLFESTDPFKGWSGTGSSGLDIQQGVYVYKLSYSYFDKHGGYSSRSFTGTVTLIR
ncbi:MAG: gliding motility-associated-like protein [Glaciecola sp.]|jgi:gliding motility-associated-like protein